ncbi:MAG: valine--tRNA ligase [Nanoarchaeota archaeon]
MDLPKQYNFKESEPRWQNFWETNKIYAFDSKSNKKIYSIDTPPPTVSGKMHIGHAFSYSQLDFVARYKRMNEFNMFFPFGTDDNGLATERLIERLKGVKGNQMDREKFIKLCLEALKNIRPGFVQDWKNIGFSADYNVFYSTIDEHCRKVSQKSFIDLYKIGREYRKEAPTIWCTHCETAIAQVELKDKELESSFNDIIFKLEDGTDLIISTTRPEMLGSCVAIFVHPDDARYQNLIGKKAKVPLFNYYVPILSDERADPERGTGIVMCCTFGDQTDIEWYKAHKLPLVMSIDKTGKMNENAGKYSGLTIKEARERVIEDLKKEHLLISQKKIRHVVNTHERCGTEIEILNTKQWFIKYLDLKEKFLQAAKKLDWHPDFMINRYNNWVKGLQWDWCISRQRFFGVPFPVWYCKRCDEVMLADEKDLPVDPLKDKLKKKCKCGSKEFIPEKDVLDTWATSSLTPEIAASLFPKLFNKLFPMSLRANAHDIITFWLFNTLVKSQLHYNKNPWKDIMISGFVLDPNREKMSKSKGNIVEPQTVIEIYGADTLRFWAAGSKLGEDMAYQEKDIITGQRFITKLWNASKFSIMHLKDFDGKKAKLEVMDIWLLSKLNRIIKESTDSFESHEYSKTKLEVENFFWHTFCDNYLEIIKDRIYNPDKRGNEAKKSAQYTLYNSLLTILKLIAPITPYITEEIYQSYFIKKEKQKSIHITSWPRYDAKMIDNKSEEIGDLFVKILSEVRQFKTKNNKSLKEQVILTLDKKDKEKLEPVLADLKATANAKEINEGNNFEVKFV